MELLKEKGIRIPVFCGGTIPPGDVKTLKEMGIAEVFGPGSSLREIVKKVREMVGDDRETDGKSQERR